MLRKGDVFYRIGRYMNKTRIFDDIVSIVRHDAAFCKDIAGADAEAYRALISDDIDDEAFLYTVQSYLASFQVIGHLSFRKVGRKNIPYTVKRYQDALYVVSVATNSPLDIGDRIIGIDGLTVPEFARRHEVMLYGEPEARQGFAWFTLLSYAKNITAEHGGETVTLPVVLDAEWDEGERYYCKKLRENVAYMRLMDFSDDTAIVNMYRESDALLRSCEYLIIDVRENGGGNDSAYAPLFEFCLSEGEKVANLPKGQFDTGIEINYSERNTDSRLAQFEQALAQDIPSDTRNMLTQFVNELKLNRGKGFVKLGSDESNELPYVGTELPRRVYIITDEDCASSGDAFVGDIGKCGKVTVVGRPTMGILDYSNCTGAFYDDYVLVYPTSRSLYLDNGVHMRHCGVPVEVHIPWTPEHCVRDVDLETVLEMIEKQ